MRGMISCSSGSDVCATVTPVHLSIYESPSARVFLYYFFGVAWALAGMQIDYEDEKVERLIGVRLKDRIWVFQIAPGKIGRPRIELSKKLNVYYMARGYIYTVDRLLSTVLWKVSKWGNRCVTWVGFLANHRSFVYVGYFERRKMVKTTSRFVPRIWIERGYSDIIVRSEWGWITQRGDWRGNGRLILVRLFFSRFESEVFCSYIGF